MKNIYLLIGIPGSGKTHWLKDTGSKKNCILDDISQIQNPLDLLKIAINDNQVKDIYISDVNFLEISILKKAELMIEEYLLNKPYNINYVVFKSNKIISEHNVNLRNDGRNVNATIKRFYKNYEEIINYLTEKKLKIIETQMYKKENFKIK